MLACLHALQASPCIMRQKDRRWAADWSLAHIASVSHTCIIAMHHVHELSPQLHAILGVCMCIPKRHQQHCCKALVGFSMLQLPSRVLMANSSCRLNKTATRDLPAMHSILRSYTCSSKQQPATGRQAPILSPSIPAPRDKCCRPPPQRYVRKSISATASASCKEAVRYAHRPRWLAASATRFPIHACTEATL